MGVRKILLLSFLLIALAALAGCGAGTPEAATSADSLSENPEDAESGGYVNITQDEAKRLMDTLTDYVILDVRTQSEYDDGHIENAVLLPDYEISERAAEVLPDKSQTILVYCRSGRRSKAAAEKLEEMGYTDIREFGGIIDWTYGTVK